jgi:tetratricopeptide (TPR) repeat protein
VTRCAGALLCIVLVIGLVSRAPAQTGPRQLLIEQQYDEAFRAMYRDPSNIQISLDYAKIAALAGDLEGAIGALERVLLYNPQLEQVQFELGNLYYRLGSYAAAESWYSRALAGDLDAEDRVIAQRDLAEIADQTRHSRLSGVLTTGISHQSNANAGPVAAASILGVNAQPGPRAKADSNVFASASLAHSYDLDRQNGDVWETRGTFYATRQFRQHALNVSLAEIDSGPRFFLNGLEDTSTSLRPYLIGTLFGLGNSLYFGGGGAGLGYTTTLLPALTLETAGELRGFGFHNFAGQPNATDQNGVEGLARVGLAYALSDKDQITTQFVAAKYEAAKSFESHSEYDLIAGYSHRFDAPWAWSDQPWTASLSAGRTWRPYRQPNPQISRTVARSDREWDLGASLQLGLSERWFALSQVAQVWAGSSLPDFRYHNTTVSLAVGYAF